MSMIRRLALEAKIRDALKHNPVVALLGPRQCGKTTVARSIAAGRGAAYFDLEDPADMARLSAARMVLAPLKGLVVLDEVQRKPEILGLLRVLADRRPLSARFLTLGSASPWVVRGVSESLAGRVGIIEMGGFDLREMGADRLDKLWLRGGFPRSFLAGTESRSAAWREDFVRLFLERDVPQLGISIPAQALRRFWVMVAHYHGQVWNAAEFARSIGSSEPTARRYLDLLSGAYVVRQLAPWHENLRKRQVKAPKVYVRDSGLLHSLLSITSRRELTGHPKFGASWEGFALEQVLSLAGHRDAYFWATHSGAELDLLLVKKGKRWGFEFKCTDTPQLTKSMRIALHDLGLKRLYVVHPGAHSYALSRSVTALALSDLVQLRGGHDWSPAAIDRMAAHRPHDNSSRGAKIPSRFLSPSPERPVLRSSCYGGRSEGGRPRSGVVGGGT